MTGMEANEKDRAFSNFELYVKHQLRGHRIAGHSLQMLDAIGLLLGQDARREALLHILVDLKIVPRLRPR
jgi:hypothetical protein